MEENTQVGKEATPEEVAKIEAERAAAREGKSPEEIAVMDAEEAKLAEEVNAKVEAEEREAAAAKAAEVEAEEKEAEEARAEEKAKEEEARKAEEEKKASVDEGTISVYNANGAFVRAYTEDMSDEDKTYIEKAKGYAKKIGGTVK